MHSDAAASIKWWRRLATVNDIDTSLQLDLPSPRPPAIECSYRQILVETSGNFMIGIHVFDDKCHVWYTTEQRYVHCTIYYVTRDLVGKILQRKFRQNEFLTVGISTETKFPRTADLS